jgi:sulfur carrier protein
VIQVRINGEDQQLAADATVEAVVALTCTSSRGIAVALNGDVVPRSTWGSVALSAGDEVEIVGAVAGG